MTGHKQLCRSVPKFMATRSPPPRPRSPRTRRQSSSQVDSLFRAIRPGASSSGSSGRWRPLVDQGRATVALSDQVKPVKQVLLHVATITEAPARHTSQDVLSALQLRPGLCNLASAEGPGSFATSAASVSSCYTSWDISALACN